MKTGFDKNGCHYFVESSYPKKFTKFASKLNATDIDESFTYPSNKDKWLTFMFAVSFHFHIYSRHPLIRMPLIRTVHYFEQIPRPWFNKVLYFVPLNSNIRLFKQNSWSLACSN